MPLDTIEVCNSALAKIGTDSIISLTDNTKQARLCKLRFDPCRRIVLRRHPWNCAIERLVLAPSTTPNPWGPLNIFPYPKDCLRVLEVGDDVFYRIEGRNLVSSEMSLKLKYVYNLTDVTQMDELLGEAIACYLAWDICYAITQASNARDVAWKAYLAILRDAKSVDAQEERDYRIHADLFVDSRISRVTEGSLDDGES